MDPWSSSREVAHGVLRSSPIPDKGLFFAIGEGTRIFVVCFLRTRGQKLLYQTPGRRPPRNTDRVENTVTLGWVGAPNERAPFRIHDAVVGFLDRCLSRTRNLADSNEHLAELFSGRSWPNICPGIICLVFLKSLKRFFQRFVPIARGTEILWQVSLKFKLALATSRFHCHRSIY